MIGVVHFGRKKMTNFTNFKYADCMDEKCPYCYSQNIEGYETDDLVTAEFSGSTVINNQQCNDCKKRWYVCYEITSRFGVDKLNVDGVLIDTFHTYHNRKENYE